MQLKGDPGTGCKKTIYYIIKGKFKESFKDLGNLFLIVYLL